MLLIACAGAPVQEMSDARQAVAAAEQSLAGKPETPDLVRAKTYLQAAQTALDAGDFGTAREDAQSARQLALRAMNLPQPTDASSHPDR
jgi:acyl-CoA synthetase (NDP forming)